MAKDTLTLALHGDVLLDDFAKAITDFKALVNALATELGAVDDVAWYVHDLQVSSALATVRGESEAIEKVERVVSAYGDIGKALQEGRRPDYSEPVVQHAQAITRILNDHITSIRFETADTDWLITSQPRIEAYVAFDRAYGGIEGRIQTLTNRKGLRFTLFDVFHDRAVSCYLREGQEEQLRELWGKRAVVEGEITRDKDTGRPLAIRSIVNIRSLPKVEVGSYLSARGVAPRRPDAPIAEKIIRQLRDA